MIIVMAKLMITIAVGQPPPRQKALSGLLSKIIMTTILAGRTNIIIVDVTVALQAEQTYAAIGWGHQQILMKNLPFRLSVIT